MSFATNLANLATRVSTEVKALRTLINGNTSDLSGLNTTTKAHLVAAINEVKTTADTALSSAGSQTVAGLDDVALATPATGHLLRYNSATGKWENVAGTTHFDPAGSAAAAQANAIAASQPLDSDLSAIAALTTTSYGRAFLALANQAGLMGLLASASETVQGKVELATVAEATAGTDSVRAVTPAGLKAAIDAVKTAILGAGVPAALDTLDELAAALGDDANFASTVTTALAGKQPLDADLTSIAAQGSAANKALYATGAGTWSLYDLSAFGRTLAGLADAAAARTTLSVYSQAQIGDPETDLVAIFEAGLA